MTLQERLRVQYNMTAMDEFEEAADALDAQAERIKELEGALRDAIKHWEGWCMENNGSMPDKVMGCEAEEYERAREALDPSAG